MVQAFRKELNDLRQREIGREIAERAPARRPTHRRCSAVLASALHRIADRLEPAHEHRVETVRIVGRHP